MFVAATDSAVPCAMLLDIARHVDVTATLKPGCELTRSYVTLVNSDYESDGIKLLFFDGEEAFQMWTKTDSL